MKKWKKAVRLLTALILALTLAAADVSPVLAVVTQEDINALKSDATALNNRKKELEKELSALAADKSKALERKNLLDQRVDNTAAQIRNVEAQIEDYAALIDQAEADLADAQQREAEKYELFCKRVREMEEQGNVTYWSVLFKAESFSDLLGRLDIINEIMDADQRVIDSLKALQAEIEVKKADLESAKADSEAAKADLLVKKSELDKQRQEAIDLVNEIRSNESKYKSTLNALDAE